MTDEDKPATEILQHRAGYLAGERSLVFPIKILCPKQVTRSRAQRVAHRLQCRKGGSETDMDAADVCDLPV